MEKLNITLKRKLITKIFLTFIELMMPEWIIDEGESGNIDLIPEWSVTPGSDSIEYSRSQFDLCSSNWADPRTHQAEEKMNVILKEIVEKVMNDEITAYDELVHPPTE